jgi:hypothetical protein
MPRHQRVTACRKNGGPVSDHCPCEHCTLTVCAVCGGSESGLTTDCPGSRVDFDKQQEVYETALDYTDERGWHLGATMKRSPRFTMTKLPPEPPRVDPRAIVAPSIDWATVDRYTHLQHELTQKAIAWACADRITEDLSAVLTHLEDEIDARFPRKEAIIVLTGNSIDINLGPDEQTRELLGKLEHGRIEFRLANARAEKCAEEFHQAAKTLLATLEDSQVVSRSDEMLFTRTCGCTVVAGDACPHFVAASSSKDKDPAAQ